MFDHEFFFNNSSQIGQCNTISLVNVEERISQLENTPDYPPSTIYTTLDSVTAAEGALTDAQAFRRVQFQLEEAAIEKSKKALLRAYAIQDEATRAALLALRQQHNTLVPVARIPPEILATIFSCLMDIDIPRKIQTSHYESWNSFGWLAVTYVCQRWRQVALQHTVLWHDIIFRFGRKWASRFTSLAGNTLLTIRKSDVDVPWHLEFLVDNMWRTQSLCVDAYRNKSLNALHIEAPLLHTLDINIHTCSEFPDDFLWMWAPALRHLRFTSPNGATMPWSLPPFRHLISLELDDRFALLEDVLGGLSHISTLERLHMHLTMDRQRRTLASERVVALAKLVHLELSSSAIDATELLRHILLPSHATIHFLLSDQGLEDMHAFFPVALESVHSHPESASEINAITGLTINMTFNHLSRTPGVSINLRKDNSALRKPALSFHFTSTLLTLSTLVPMVIKAFSSAHLKELVVGNTHNRYDGQLEAWAQLVGCAPGLRSLTVAGNAAISFCAALRLAITHAPGDKPPAMLFLPKLSILILSDMRLGIDGAAIDPELENEGERLADALPLRLAERAAAGYTLDELDVVGCDVDEAWVARTREALPGTRVKWDEGARFISPRE
ncbi:hypothetical protein FA95DRAFT_1609943 [Auriscalpium vulgare]|uniref:Uncharacterized protein n=1 Tax=Auriscalpium vulgare TaxID=40419 RepID=A0ACB8RET7_9AGAM|nr:hypothetical protein FA95DRAFT_1609943 [Auriscalpium vulgare]